MAYTPSYQIAENAIIGGQVGVSSGTHYGDTVIGTVVRMTKTRVIVSVPGYNNSAPTDVLFNRRGEELGQKYHPRNLLSVEDAQERNADKLAKRELHVLRNRLSDYNWQWASKEIVTEVLALLAARGAPAAE